MNRLGLKIIISYIFVAIISTFIFFLSIQSFILHIYYGENIIINDDTSKIISNTMYSVFLATMLITLVISLIFEISILRAVTKIRANIKDVAINKDINWQKINTRDELEEINEELYIMVKKIQDYDKSQKEFFQNTSHELKTPLMSIQGYAEAIKDKVIEENETDEALDIIIEESKKLSSMITSILYLGSLEKSYSKNSEIINIFEKIEKLKVLFDYNISEKNIYVENNIPNNLQIYANSEKFDNVLNNLFSNSIRYTKTKVKFDYYENSNNIYFSISDDGNGFEKSSIDRVFDRFFKGIDGKNGLGLSIVKAIVENYGGKVRAYNQDSGGAVIEIELAKEMLY